MFAAGNRDYIEKLNDLVGGTRAFTALLVGVGVSWAGTMEATTGSGAIQVGDRNTIQAVAAGNFLTLNGNARFDGANWKYIETAAALTYQIDPASDHYIWYRAPSGTAGTTATFAELMRLSATALTVQNGFILNKASGTLLAAVTSGANQTYIGWDAALAVPASAIETNGALAILVGGSFTEVARFTTTGLAVVGTLTASGASLTDTLGGNDKAQLRLTNTTSAAIYQRRVNASNYEVVEYWNGASWTRFTTLTSGGALVLGTSVTVAGTTTSAAGEGAMQLGSWTLLQAYASGTVTGIFNNARFDGSDSRYIGSSVASLYEQSSGIHKFYAAPTGTAGNVVSFAEMFRIGTATEAVAQFGVQMLSGTTGIFWIPSSGMVVKYNGTGASGDRYNFGSGGNLVIGGASSALSITSRAGTKIWTWYSTATTAFLLDESSVGTIFAVSGAGNTFEFGTHVPLNCVVYAVGAGTGSAAGSVFYAKNGSTIVAGFGNYSVIHGGAYNGYATLYSANDIYITHNASSAIKAIFANAGLYMANSTGAAAADFVDFYSSDDAAGHTIPSFYCEGSNVVATGQVDSPSSVRIKMRFQGVVHTFLCL